MDTPDRIKSLSETWNESSWKNYSVGELAMWTLNLTKRSLHRQDDQADKINGDLKSADDYFSMLKAHVERYQIQGSLPKQADFDRLDALSNLDLAQAMERKVDLIKSGVASDSDKREINAGMTLIEANIEKARLIARDKTAQVTKKRGFFSSWMK